MKRFLLCLLCAIVSYSSMAEGPKRLINIDPATFRPEQKDVLVDVNIDQIAKDRSKRPCARIKLHVNRMTREEIDQLQVVIAGGNVALTKKETSYEGNGLIIEMTAKPQTRFHIHHDKYGDSNEVTVDLEGNKVYQINAQLDLLLPIALASNVKYADVYIDDEYKGATDNNCMLTVENVTPGEHKITLKQGALVAEKVVNVSMGNISFRVDVGQNVAKRDVEVEFFGKRDKNAFVGFQKLYAKVNRDIYKVEIEEGMCFDIIEQDDFDNDGVVDALVENIQACGGNGMGNSYFFVTYKDDGYFSVSNSFGTNVWEKPTISDWYGAKSVVIFDTNYGFNREKPQIIRERYILKDGNAVKVENSRKNSVETLQEIQSSDFHNGKEQETIRMSYDLDDNGQIDIIECTYWERWNLLFFDIILNGKSLGFGNLGVHRIAVSSNVTNGVRDLIYNENSTAKWNGTTYDFDKK